MQDKTKGPSVHSPTPVYVPPGGPPKGPGPSKGIYVRMGEANIFRMCADFYARLEVSPIRRLFPEDMLEASKKLGAFLVQVCGGPALYLQRHGDPMMRSRHLAIPIDEAARNVWLNCFKETLKDSEPRYNFPPEHLPGFIRYLEDLSAWMINQK